MRRSKRSELRTCGCTICGTLAVQAFPITDVQGYLGHAHISTTMRYVHHTASADDAARLQAVLSRDVSPTVSRTAAIGRN
jgi:integrase